MKRNNLMKRMAVVALAATMSVGMAVPAMAATTPAGVKTGDVFSGADPWDVIHYDDAETYPMYMLDSFEDTVSINFFNGWVGNTVVSGSTATVLGTPGYIRSDTSAANNAFIQTEDGRVYENLGQLTVSGSPVQLYNSTNEYYREVREVLPGNESSQLVLDHNNGAWTVTVGSRNRKNDTGFYVVWTITPQTDANNGDYFDLSIKNNELTFSPKAFGTTVYKYKGVLYHNGKEVNEPGFTNSATGKFAVNMPLNEDTINEAADEGLTVDPSVCTTSPQAATAATNAIKAALNARGPKMLNYTAKELKNWKGVDFLSHFSGSNVAHDLSVAVDNVTDFHYDATTKTGSYKAHVVVTDNTLSEDNVYDLGIKTFLIKGDDTPVFDDVASTAYYYDAVVWGVKNGVVKGTSDTTFSPYDNFTREQVALMLYRKAGSPVVDYSDVETVKFHDIGSLSEESKRAIAWGVQNGIIKGTSDVTFSPKEGITRAQLVTLLYRLSGDTAEYNEDGFTDVQHGKYYEDAVDWAVAKGVTTGTTKTTFSPYDVTTRAQGITFLYRFYNLK